jgi:hypothetical protein
MSEPKLSRVDRLDLLALLNREIGHVGISSAAGQRAMELIAKLVPAAPVVDDHQPELVKMMKGASNV